MTEEAKEKASASEPEDSAKGKPQKKKSSGKRVRSYARRTPESGREVLTDFITYRSGKAGEKLRQQLSGKIVVKLRDGKGEFLFDWTKSDLKLVADEDFDKRDCSIGISEKNLLEIVNGQLNPQVAMLSDKVHVSGTMTLAVYFFNLLAPN